MEPIPNLAAVTVAPATEGPGTSSTRHYRRRHHAALISVLVGFLMLGLKMGAFLITNSNAVLSDALESVVHVGATALMYYCLRVASRPPDVDHPYGHGKVEYFSVAFEGGMILLAALAVFWQAGRALWLGNEVKAADVGFWLTALAAVINIVLALYLIGVGKRTRSVILVADGKHVLSDVYTSAGALAGVGLIWWTGWQQLDAYVALVLGLVIFITAVHLIREAVSGLMDEADPKLVEAVVAAVNEIRDPAWLDLHNLRLRTAGDFTYIDFHLVVPAEWTVDKAHQAMDKLEGHILARLDRQGAVMVHLDYPKYDREFPAPSPQPFTAAIATRVGPK